MTGSKTVLQTFNRSGHSMSYDDDKVLVTESAFTVSDDNQETPDAFLCKSNLATATAWDNYAVNIETLDGKSTWHANVVRGCLSGGYPPTKMSVITITVL